MISVIIAAYNAEKYITECLDSVLGQTYSDLEAIVVDDGSKDATWDIVQKYAERDKRVVAIRQENQGPAAARNRAFDVMKGDFFTILDSDDWIDKHCYKDAVTVAMTSDADMVMWGFKRFTNEQEIPQKPVKGHLGLYDEEECKKLWLDFIYREGQRVNTFLPCRLIRSSLLNDKKLRLDPKLVRSEDYMLLCQLHFYCKKIFSIEDRMYLHYRQIGGSITHRYVDGYFEMVKRIYSNLLTFACENDAMSDECLARADRMLIYRLLLCVENEIYHEVDNETKKRNLKVFIEDDMVWGALKKIGLSEGYQLFGKKYIALRLKALSFLLKAYGR